MKPFQHDYPNSPEKPLDATEAGKRLMAAATVDALKAAVEALPEPIRNDPHVQNAKAARWHQLNQKEAA